jgi:hypothetical protein
MTKLPASPVKRFVFFERRFNNLIAEETAGTLARQAVVRSPKAHPWSFSR